MQDEFMKQNLQNIDNRLLTQILTKVLCDKNVVLKNIPLLSKYLQDVDCQWTAIRSILQGDNLAPFYAKIMNALCLMVGSSGSAKLIAKMVFAAHGEVQLKNLLSFLLSVMPHYPTVLTMAIQHLVENVEFLINEYPDTPWESKNRSQLEVRFIFNLLTILLWQNQSDDNGSLRCLGLNFADIRGEIHESLLDWGIDYTRRIELISGAQINGTYETVLNAFFNLMKIATPKVQLNIVYPQKLLVQFSALIVNLLKLLEAFDSSLDGMDVVCRCFAVTGRFFSSQVGATKKIFVSSLVGEVFENAHILFGTEAVVSVYPRFDNYLRQIELARQEAEPARQNSGAAKSTLQQLRQMPIGMRSAATIAHSGKFKRKRRRCEVLQKNFSKPIELRRMLFLNMIENISTGHNRLYDLNICKHLGQTLIDHFTGDGFTSCYTWNDWELERELTPKFLEIGKKMESFPLVFDIMLTLTEIGFCGFYYLLPLVKAYYVSILIQLETTPLKQELVSLTNVRRISRLLSILISAKFFPTILNTCFELISQISNYETYTLLLGLWNFLKLFIRKSSKSAQLLHSQTREDLLNLQEAAPFIQIIVCIIQRNIVRLGKYLPRIIDANRSIVPDNVW